MTVALRPFAVFSMLVVSLAACSESEPPTIDATGGTAPTGGASTTGGTATGGAAVGGAGAGASGGAAGTATGGAGGTGGDGGAAAGVGGGGGSAGGGAAGQAGNGGSAANGGNAGDGGRAGAGGESGGRAGSGGASGAGGMGGRGGAGGSGGMAAYDPCPTAPAPCVVLPYGDSITDGFNVPGGYRMELFRKARADGKGITFVGSGMNGPTMVDGQMFPRNHEGHSGFTIDGIAALVETATGFDPNIVLLMIGTNDLNNNVNVSQAPTRLGNLIDAMFQRRADMLVVVAQIVPGRQDSLNSRVMTYNAAIPGLVSTRAAAGRHIVMVDMYGAFTRDENYKQTLLADDLHPSTAGYTRMAETWYAAIAGLLR